MWRWWWWQWWKRRGEQSPPATPSPPKWKMWSRLQDTKPLFHFVTSYESESESSSVVSSSLRPYVLHSPWNSPGQDTGVGRLSLLQGIFHNSQIEPRSPTLQADSLPAEPQGKPKNTGMGSLYFLQQIFLTQESMRDLLNCRWILYQLSYQGSPTSYGSTQCKE